MLNIRTKANQLPFGFFAGLIQIDTDPNWYTGAVVPSEMDWETLHVGMVDLYTAVLHEGMHLLGVASTFGGVELVGGGVTEGYTDWDNYLYKKNSPNNYTKLIIPAIDPVCCGKNQVNPLAPTSFPGTCDVDIMFRDENGPTDFAEVSYQGLNPTDIQSTNNRLSHLDIECSPDKTNAAFQYVMHPGIPPSPELYSFPRRILTPAELGILCSVGYPASGGCNNTCVILANDDHYANPIYISGGNNPATLALGPYIGSFSLLGNDVLPPGYQITLCGHDNEISVEIVGNNVLVTGLQPGTWTFCYKISSNICPGNCGEATVTVYVLNHPIPIMCNSTDCNLVCYGDFEAFPVGQTYYSSLNLPEFHFKDISPNGNNTPDIYLQTDVAPENKVIRWVRSTNNVIDQESLRIPLSQPIYAGCTATINYRGVAASLGTYLLPQAIRMEVYGLTASPCQAIDNQPVWSGVQQPNPLCPGVTSYGMDQHLNFPFDADVTGGPTNTTNLNLEDYSFLYTHPVGAPPITDLLIWGTFTPANPPLSEFEGVEFYMDDIIVTSSCNTQVNITPTIKAQCIAGLAIVEYEVCLLGAGGNLVPINLQAQVPPELTVVPGGGFDGTGLASFQLIPGIACNGGANTTILTLTMNVSANFDPLLAPIPVFIPMNFVGNNLCIDPATGNGGDVELELVDCSQELACDCDPNPNEVGSNMSSTTELTTSGLPNMLDGICLTVNGRFEINEDFNLNNTYVIMNRGAEMVVMAGKTLTLTGNTFEGCEHMWRGITVESGATLKATSMNNFYDAQWAIQAKNGSTIEVQDNTFDRDYVGIYVPETAQTVNEIALKGNTFRCTQLLKAEYTVPQNANILQDPKPGERTFAGIYLNVVTGFDIGANNLFDGVRNGVVAEKDAGFTMDLCTIKNLVRDPASSNSGTYYIDQYGVYASHCTLAEITNCTFDQVGFGIYSVRSNIRAQFNTITGFNFDSPADDIGIERSLNTNRAVRIRDNTISMYGTGISIHTALPASILRVQRNIMTMFPGSPGQHIDLQSIRGGWVANNTLTRSAASATGTGINILNCASMTFQTNNLFGLEQGFNASGCVGNIFVANHVVNGGMRGFSVFNSTDTYCSNLTDGQSEYGFYFRGVCIKPNGIRCNNIRDAGTDGLRLWADGTISTNIGTQTNVGNKWLGSYGNFGAFNGSVDQNAIQESRFYMPANQIPTWSTGLGNFVTWFDNFPGTSVNCLATCPLAVDIDPDEHQDQERAGYTDDGVLSNGDIVTAQGGHSGDGFNYMAQQRLYERLRKHPELTVQSASVQQFLNNAHNAELGQLYEVGKNTALMQGREEYAWRIIRDLQEKITEQSETLQSLRSSGPGQDFNNWWLQVRLLQQKIRQDANQLQGHENWLKNSRLSEAAALQASNTAISVSQLCAYNQRSLNDIYLSNVLWEANTPTALVLSDIKAISRPMPYRRRFCGV